MSADEPQWRESGKTKPILERSKMFQHRDLRTVFGKIAAASEANRGLVEMKRQVEQPCWKPLRRGYWV